MDRPQSVDPDQPDRAGEQALQRYITTEIDELISDDFERFVSGCSYPDSVCLICGHEACGWCPECSPGVPY